VFDAKLFAGFVPNITVMGRSPHWVFWSWGWNHTYLWHVNPLIDMRMNQVVDVVTAFRVSCLLLLGIYVVTG
jgi:hypothetical protein